MKSSEEKREQSYQVSVVKRKENKVIKYALKVALPKSFRNSADVAYRMYIVTLS